MFDGVVNVAVSVALHLGELSMKFQLSVMMINVQSFPNYNS